MARISTGNENAQLTGSTASRGYLHLGGNALFQFLDMADHAHAAPTPLEVFEEGSFAVFPGTSSMS